MRKKRLDLLITELGLSESRSMAQRLIMAGQVLVNGQRGFKPSQMVDPDTAVEIIMKPRYVSRGGEKLEAALEAFKLIDLKGWICADVGSSTGGFTDCLLSYNAKKVYAIDVGYGLMHWKLRNDPRIILMERTNVRNIMTLPEAVRLVTVDVSFISLKIIFNVISGWLGEYGGNVVALIKPQFEAGRADAARGEGVIKDRQIHREILQDVIESAQKHYLGINGLIPSPLLGPKGNIEFFIYLIKGSNEMDIHQLTNTALEECEFVVGQGKSRKY